MWRQWGFNYLFVVFLQYTYLQGRQKEPREKGRSEEEGEVKILCKAVDRREGFNLGSSVLFDFSKYFANS